jgi:hypothetical protein
VRTFIVLINVEGSHPNLMPDLTASLDVELRACRGRWSCPRDSVRRDGERARGLACSAARDSRSGRSRSAHATPTKSCRHSGLDEGAVVARNVQSRATR